jgi:branched-chain amino acid transport system permease protein
MTKRGSTLVGVNTERTTTYTYTIAGGLAGLAGLFFGMSQSVSYNVGLDPLLLVFAIVILGGVGSIKGSVVGAYIIGSPSVTPKSTPKTFWWSIAASSIRLSRSVPSGSQ